MLNKQGKLIVIEGVDGIGKTSTCNFLKENLKGSGQFIFTHEPGGSKECKKIRDLILNNDFHSNTNFFLMLADRIQHLQDVILPNLEKGINVITDRYTLSTLVYNGDSSPFGYLGISHKRKLLQEQLKLNDIKTYIVYLSTSLYQNQKKIFERLEKRKSKNSFDPTNFSEFMFYLDRYEQEFLNLVLSKQYKPDNFTNEYFLKYDVIENKNYLNELLKDIKSFCGV